MSTEVLGGKGELGLLALLPPETRLRTVSVFSSNRVIPLWRVSVRWMRLASR